MSYKAGALGTCSSEALPVTCSGLYMLQIGAVKTKKSGSGGRFIAAIPVRRGRGNNNDRRFTFDHIALVRGNPLPVIVWCLFSFGLRGPFGDRNSWVFSMPSRSPRASITVGIRQSPGRRAGARRPPGDADFPVPSRATLPMLQWNAAITNTAITNFRL